MAWPNRKPEARLGEAMTGSVIWLAVATAVFVGGHILLSGTRLRDRLAGLLGERGFLVAFSVLAALTITWMAWAFNDAPHIEIWQSGHALKAAAWLLLAPAVLFVVCGNGRTNPSAVNQGGRLAKADLPRGIFTITRHPMMAGIGLWALAHILANGDVASLVFFGGLLVLVLAGVASQDAKKARTLGEPWRRFAAETSMIPFVAVLLGRARLDLRGIGWLPILISIVVYVLLVFLHPFVIGVSPMP